jgi:hypothetical protein
MNVSADILKSHFHEKILFLFVLLLLTSCGSEKPQFEVEGFDPLSNWQKEIKQKSVLLDYTYALDSGFIIPTINQVPSGEFVLTFKIKNVSGKKQQYYFKLYYQNETYKYPEPFSSTTMNPLASENFYGSWEETSLGFIPVHDIQADNQYHSVSYSFRMVGNPRDESEYYGTERIERPFTLFQTEEMKKYIRSNAAWMEDIKNKAVRNKISVEEQIHLDAIYALNERRKGHRFNNRWKRNLRTGTYSFLLVVTTEEDYHSIPVYIHDISVKVNDKFINPYWYFLYGPGKKLKNTVAVLSDITLKVSARPELGNGIFIDGTHLASYGIDYKTDKFNARCNNDSVNYTDARFSQYFHYIMAEMSFKNIPEIKNLSGNELTLEDYKNYLKTYNEGNMVNASIGNTDCPCKDVYSDKDGGFITITTPAAEPGKWKKTNVGVISRHGFTYGRFTAKIKFPELLNDNQVWNGLTNAFWMLNESNEEWNRVRECKKKGFIPKDRQGEFAERVASTSYSEIDIEIRKASPVWPVTSYNYPLKRPFYDGSDLEDIILTCTNWDLACEQPKRFSSGTQFSRYLGQEFLLHRWNPWYQALTTKYPVKDDELNKRDYYYYQIEWKPDTLIWRIGPEKDNMKIVCFMDAKITTVPNNQMLMVITQEYHPSIWWPESPQLLEYIPFPKNSIEGKILEIEIE